MTRHRQSGGARRRGPRSLLLPPVLPNEITLARLCFCCVSLAAFRQSGRVPYLVAHKDMHRGRAPSRYGTDSISTSGYPSEAQKAH
jgi:hypothetical protein